MRSTKSPSKTYPITFSANVLWPSGVADVVIGIVTVVVLLILVVLWVVIVVIFTGCDFVVVLVAVDVVVAWEVVVSGDVIVVKFVVPEVVVKWVVVLFKVVDVDLEVSEIVWEVFVVCVVDFGDLVSFVFLIVVFATFEPTVAISLFLILASSIEVVGKFVCFDPTIELRIKQLILKQAISMIRRIFKIRLKIEQYNEDILSWLKFAMLITKQFRC